MTRMQALVALLTSWFDAHPWPAAGDPRRTRTAQGSDGGLSFMLAAIERQRRAHSHPAWRDLADALAYLAATDHAGAVLVTLTYVLAIENPATMRDQQRRQLVQAMRTLEAAMAPDFERRLPPEITEAHHERQRALVEASGRGADPRAQAARDAEIRRLYDTGEWTHAELARDFNLARSTVTEIVSGRPVGSATS